MHVIWIIICCAFVRLPVAIAGTIKNIHIRNSQPAVKGRSIQLVCEISQFSSQDLVNIYKTDARVLSGSLPTALVQCFPSLCLTGDAGRYTFSADSSHVYVNITNLNRSEDQKWWTCVVYSQRKDIQLMVYTFPKTLQFGNTPNQDQDLSVNMVSLRCRTGCVYPQPNFTWEYNESGGSNQKWTTSGSTSQQTGTCTDSEMIYTSTLSLPRYTIFPGNIEKTVKFVCSIASFPGMTQPLYTSPSVNVQFAVQVTNVALKDGISTPPNPLKVTSGVHKTLTCTTSVNRPAATVVWYIGTEEKQRSSSSASFTFTPQNSDHNKQVFCKAYNIQQEDQAVSSKKVTLDVWVQVTSVTLTDGNSEPCNPLQVTSGVPKTLTCTTGITRPPSTVVWYIGTEEKQRSSTSFLFTPQNSDHNKQIYCKAFNIQPESQAVTSKNTRIYVQAFSQIPSSTGNISGSPKSINITLIVGVSLGVVCVFLGIVAVYFIKETYTLRRRVRKFPDSTTINSKSITTVTRGHELNTSAAFGDVTTPQYTDLSRYANIDADTYDVIYRI